jgi:hypothetical protein
MHRLTASVLVLFTSIAFISCSKEVSFEPSSSGSGNAPGSGSNGTLLGNYKFISMEVSTKAIEEISVGVSQKTITTSHYTTANNSGTMNFDGSKATANNLSYSVDTVAKAEIYINGALQDSLEMPFQFTLPPSSSTAPYKMVGSDSIYFSQGSFFVDGSSSTSTQTTPSGAKLTFVGDKVLMTTKINDVTTTTIQGVSVKETRIATTVVTLQKQ